MAKSPKKGLAAQLQKYYTREGNRIMFSNGMTLNRLAWEMWERLGYRQIDPSVISRVLKGERLFSPKQLGIFCEILGIRKTSRQILLNELLLDLNLRFGLDTSYFDLGNRAFINLLSDDLKRFMVFFGER